MTTQIDGCPVRDDVATAFTGLAEHFQQLTEHELHITAPLGGERTRAQQQDLYDAYLHGGALAADPADPSAAHHIRQEDGGEASALDLHDSGADAGVNVIGSPRHTTLLSILAQHGFQPEGDTFHPAEGWHVRYIGGGTSASPTTTTLTSTTSEGDEFMMIVRVDKAIYLLGPGYKHLFTAEEWDQFPRKAIDKDFGAAPAGSAARRAFDLTVAVFTQPTK
ncbi:MAG TPA: hypothetical protein VGC45_15810 [Gryllotalpicola sp.]